jgi:23S rRNA (uracil1939-C5)-methyltransferase
MSTAPASNTLRIDTMLYGGEARGQAANGAFVPIPFALPGELIDIQSDANPRILEPSPDRVPPACAHFGACGGCQYQHASYPAQLALKQSILRDTLLSAGLTELPTIATHSAEPWHYRNRIRLRLAMVDGVLRAGYNRRASTAGNSAQPNQEPQFLPITACPIATPLLWRAAEALTALASTSLDPTAQRWLAAAVEAELFTNADQTRLQLTLFTRTAKRKQPSATGTSDQGFTKLCLVLQHHIPELTGAGIAYLPTSNDRGRRYERPKPGPQWGSPGLLYRTPATSEVSTDQDFWITRGGFFQVNRFLLPELARIATSGRTGTLAWDLYAGVGLFSRALTQGFHQVVAVEAAEASATDLARALKATRESEHRAVASTTLDFLQSAVLQRERPDLIVMDPPRAGVGAEVCALLNRLQTQEIVYVSCDPVTLARDLALLVEGGYRLAELHLVDMFPQTFHLETVAILHR